MSDNVPEIILTDQGAQLMARAVAGEKATFTRLIMGDGQLANIGGIRGLTALIHERVSVPITKTTRKNNDLTLAGEVTIPTDAGPFRWRELGVLGRIGTEPEALVGYLYKGETGEMVDPAETVERSIYITVQVDAAADVTVTLVPRATVEWDQITDKPDAYPPSNHNHAWGEITGKPGTFQPSAHNHTWSSITGKPSAFQPATHTHSYLPLAGGTLTGNLRIYSGDNDTVHKLNLGDGEYVYISEPEDDVMEIHAKEVRFTGCGDASASPLALIQGGTGATTAAGARANIGAVASFGPVTVTLYASSWSGSGPWTQTVSLGGVTASDSHLHVYPVDVSDKAARKLYEKAYACLAAQAESVAGGIKFTCRDDKPTTNFHVMVEGVR